MATEIVVERYWLAAVLLSEIPARIPTTQHLGSIMNLVFYDAARDSGSKKRKPTFADLYTLKNTEPERFSTGRSQAICSCRFGINLCRKCVKNYRGIQGCLLSSLLH